MRFTWFEYQKKADMLEISRAKVAPEFYYINYISEIK